MKSICGISAGLRLASGTPAEQSGNNRLEGAALSSGYQPVSINCMLSALNGFLNFLGRGDCRVRYLRIQRRLFRGRERELNREEYLRLLETAQKEGRERLRLLMETICATGIRVSEVRYITVEATRRGHAEIFLKGKVRVILLPGKLCRKLMKYAKKKKIGSGEIFLTRTRKGDVTKGDLVSDEIALRRGEGGAFQGVPP